MKTYFALISDCVFTLAVCFLLCFFALNYFIERPFSIAFAFILAAAITMLYFKIALDKYSASKSQRKAQKELDAAVFSLNLLTAEKNNLLLIKALTKQGYRPERKKCGVFLSDKAAAIFLFFSFSPVTKADVVKVFNNLKNGYTAYMVAPSFDGDIIDFISRFEGKIKTATAKDYYLFLKENDCLPKERLPAKQEKKGLNILSALLEKRKAKRFLSFGLIFLGMTFIVPFKIYYTVSGCLFLLYALILHLFGRREKAEN